SRYELGDDQARHAVTLEGAFGPAHAGVRRQADPANELEHPIAVAATRIEPGNAADARAGDREGQSPTPVHRILDGLRAGEHEHRTRRNRRAELLEYHRGEYRQQPVAAIKISDLHS